VPLNKFEVLRSRMMQKGEGGGRRKSKEGGRSQTDKDRKEEEKGKTVERGDGEDWVKTGGRGRGNCGRCVVG